ncbi:hypothetical protein [Streptococcus marmotae]|uniref:hypothetical protein n=1 Tax=Streptococcus marmotae TaxID=1825069 RepID=UPI000830067B|nr:hypothetical protein [Streptococcus marmotae]
MNLLERMKPYSKCGAWAIWESNREDGHFIAPNDMVEDTDFSKFIDELQPNNYVILGMNPGGVLDPEAAKTATRLSNNVERPWNNFHNIGKSNDHGFAEALNNSILRGSYMTDFFPIPGSSSDGVIKFVTQKENAKLVERLVKELDEELHKLLPDQEEIILICIGSTSKAWTNKYLIEPSTRIKGLKNTYKVIGLPHYSNANRRTIKNLSEKYSVENNYASVVNHILQLELYMEKTKS